MAASIPEVLLALAGFESPLFDDQHREHFASITPPEAASLESLGRLAKTHRALQKHIKTILHEVPSIICRAVAQRIDSYHLPRFLEAIIAFERDVLLRDSSVVGAYEHVSLSRLVNAFSPWTRTITFLWSIACVILDPESDNEYHLGEDGAVKAAEILDRLRSEAVTGYEDIEKTAKDLISIAEAAWLRQLSTWILVGDITDITHNDFVVRPKTQHQQGLNKYTIVSNGIPSFLSHSTARSILFLGNTFRLLDDSDKLCPEANVHDNSAAYMRDYKIHTARTEPLKNVSFPIDGQNLDLAINEIRASLGRELGKGVLPTESILSTLKLCKQFLLGGRIEFIDCLVSEADHYLQTRDKSTNLKSTTDATLLSGLLMNEDEVGRVLETTWAALAPSLNSEFLDQDLEWAREHLSLSLAPSGDEVTGTKVQSSEIEEIENEAVTQLSIPDSPFKDLLLSNSTLISLQLPGSLALFFSRQDKLAYAILNSFVLAIRRGLLHLTNLWRQTKLRRNQVPIVNHSSRGSERSMASIQAARKKNNTREQALRNVWARVEAAVRILTELGTFISLNVIDETWIAFYRWATGDDSNATNDSHQDLEALATAHRNYLTHLLHACLLDERDYVVQLKHLLVTCDQLVALLFRLQIVQSKLDLQSEGVEIDEVHLEREETDIQNQLQKASNALELALGRLVSMLHEINETRVSSGIDCSPSISSHGFVPTNSTGGIDRLLLRLDTSFLEGD